MLHNLFKAEKEIRKLYHALIPYELRYWFYKIRHSKDFQSLRSAVFPSPKGDFSLRPFDCHQCLFIHITKAAGTSVAKSLFSYLPYHYTAVEYRVIFGRRAFNKYFKFAFVRNPWDRLLSAYSYLRDGGWNEQDRRWYDENISHLRDFNSFVIEWLDSNRLQSHLHLRPQSEFICDSRQRPLIDYLGYFESLPEDFAHIARVLNIEARLGHVNTSKRNDYRDIYSPEAIEKVYSVYRRDIENFGYDFACLKSRMTVRDRKFEPLEML